MSSLMQLREENEQKRNQLIKKEYQEAQNSLVTRLVPELVENYKISIQQQRSILEELLPFTCCIEKPQLEQKQSDSKLPLQIQRLHNYMMNDLYQGYYLPEVQVNEKDQREERKRDISYFSDSKAQAQMKNKPYKSFPNYIKQVIAELSLFMGQRFVKDIFDIDYKAQKRWRESGGNRKKGGGKKIQNPQIEQKTLAFLKKQHEQTGHIPQMKDVQRYGQWLIAEEKKKGARYTKFGASKGWANKILLRYKEKAKLDKNQKQINKIKHEMSKEWLDIITEEYKQRCEATSSWCKKQSEYE